MAARLKEKYQKEIKQALKKELGLENPMAVPRLEKIVINMGLGEATQNSKLLDPLVADLTQIAGQKPVTTKAKKSIAAFKVRTGNAIGAMVTLRSDKAYEFLDRLISIALPRVRDFRGLFDQEFRRARKLHHRPARPVDLSGDRLREGGKAEGHEHHHCDHGEGRQPGARAAQALRDALPPGSVRTASSCQLLASSSIEVERATEARTKLDSASCGRR